MLWILIAILSYLFSAVVAIVDKYLLTGPIPNPKVYAFYIGVLEILALFLIPLGFIVPDLSQILLSFFAGALFILALFWFCKALSLFETSRVVPAIGGLNPLFVFTFNYLILGEGFVNFGKILSFILLILGTVIITWEKEKITSLKSFKIAALSAFLFSLAFVFSKQVYSSQPFWSGFIWMRIGGFLASLFFLFFREVREEVFERKTGLTSKTGGILIVNQGFGALGFILQNRAIALVPIGLLAFVNALEGAKYAFVLLFIAFLSLRFPKILKEEISKKIIFQKIFAIVLIALGIGLLTWK